MKRNVALWMALSGAALLAAFALSLSNKELTPPQAAAEPAFTPPRSTPAPPESSSAKATTLAPLDWSAPLKSSLRDAQLGIPEAQYRAAVLLRDCRNAHMSASDFDRLRDAGLTADHISLIQRRVERCASVKELVQGDPGAASKSWFAAALRQQYPIAMARDLITGQEQPTAEEIDGALRAALEAAGDDRVLRSESFFYVLAAMDKRATATGMEADATVRNAWTLLHCREAWDCDMDATMAQLSNELTPINLRLTIERVEEISRDLQARNWSNVPLN